MHNRLILGAWMLHWGCTLLLTCCPSGIEAVILNHWVRTQKWAAKDFCWITKKCSVQEMVWCVHKHHQTDNKRNKPIEIFKNTIMLAYYKSDDYGSPEKKSENHCTERWVKYRGQISLQGQLLHCL